MNIFFLHECPKQSAIDLVDKHIVKMPLESAQMLSTAHRLLDGKLTTTSFNGKIKKLWLLPGEQIDLSAFNLTTIPLYRVAHAKHPSTVWTMEGAKNYNWHFDLFCHMLEEYTRRYGKTHSSSRLIPLLKNLPKNINAVAPFTHPVPAMPDLYKTASVVESYRRYYAGEKWRFAKWKNADQPKWITQYMADVWNDERFSDRVSALNKIAKKKTLPLAQEIFNTAKDLSRV